MAKRFIDTDVWSDVIFDNFNKDERYFWLFLLTTRYGNISGCFEISINQIMYETKLANNVVVKLLKDFEDKHKLIYYSKETNEIFILNWYKYNWSKSPLVEKSVLKFVAEIKDDFFRETINKMVIDFRESDRLSIPYRYDTISIPISNTISNTNKDDIIKEEKELDILFNQFWQEYPKKVNKQTAYKSFIKLKVNDDLLKTIISNIKERLKIGEWKLSEKQFIPNASTYLNQERWNDEIITPYKADKVEIARDDLILDESVLYPRAVVMRYLLLPETHRHETELEHIIIEEERFKR